MLAERLLCYYPTTRGDKNVVFAVYHGNRKWSAGSVWGYFAMCPRPIQRYMDHRDRTSFTEARSSTMFVFLLFVTLIFRILPNATGQSFRPMKLQFFVSKVQGPTWNPGWNWGAGTLLRGFFCPLKTPQLTKKLQLNRRSCVEHIPHGQTKFLVKKFWTRDTPKWNYWPKCSEEFRENGRVNTACCCR